MSSFVQISRTFKVFEGSRIRIDPRISQSNRITAVHLDRTSLRFPLTILQPVYLYILISRTIECAKSQMEGIYMCRRTPRGPCLSRRLRPQAF